MARYNAEMNGRWLAAATGLTDVERRAERGAFFGSIHGTFNHLLWADRVWLSRFTASPVPDCPRENSAHYVDDFDALRDLRIRSDDEIVAFAAAVTPQWLAEEVVWFEGTARQFTSQQALRVAHMFNHQTHHRGQIHALLTACGQDTGATDLWLMGR